MSSPEQPINDISQSLEQLGETTTAADLVRSKGQSKKVRIISEKKLMDWIMAMLRQHLAGRADSFSDAEKADLLARTQEELARRIQREQEADRDRDRIKGELDSALSVLSNTRADQGGFDAAISTLKGRLLETEHINQDLLQSNYDLEDSLKEKMALLTTLLDENTKLKQTVAHQMVRSNGLVEAVLAIDTEYYAGRHQHEHPPAEDASEEERFYHDFDLGAVIVQTLSGDLERLRSIASGSAEEVASRARPSPGDEEPSDQQVSLLDSDLQLLQELRAGHLHAADVAEPVAGLVEAVDGARAEAEELERQTQDALGSAAPADAAISAVPDASGDPATVLAGTTGVVRELAAVLARARQRLSALKSIADQSDEARAHAEQELARQQPAGGSAPAVADVVADQLQALHRRLASETDAIPLPTPAAGADAASWSQALQAADQALDRLVARKNQALAGLADAQRQLAEQVRSLAQPAAAAAPDGPTAAALSALDASLGQAGPPAETAPAVARAISDLLRVMPMGAPARAASGSAAAAPAVGSVEAASDLAGEDRQRLEEERTRLLTQVGQAQQKILSLERETGALKGEIAALTVLAEVRRRDERELAHELIAAAQGDESMADLTADLALVIENRPHAGGDSGHEDVIQHLRTSLTALARRKQDLAVQAERLSAEVELMRTQAGEAVQRAASLQVERDRVAQQLVAAQQRSLDLERDVARARTDIDTLRAQLSEAQGRRSSLESDHGRLQALLAQSEAKVADLEQALAAAQGELGALASAQQSSRRLEQQMAEELVKASTGDHELADATADLALALEGVPASGAHTPSPQVGQQVIDTVSFLAKRKKDLTGEVDRLRTELDAIRWQLKEAGERAVQLGNERDEMAASGKEVIALLTQQRERIAQELEALRQAHTETEAHLTRVVGRMHNAETANRQLAEALSSLAAADKSGASQVEDQRVDLEVALSQLPDEGEDEISIPHDISLQLASCGQKLAEAMSARLQNAASTLARSQEEQRLMRARLEELTRDLATARNALEDQATALRGSQAEVRAVRDEMKSQGNDLAAKVQELTALRGDMASIRAEIAVASQRMEDQERRVQQATHALSEARREAGESALRLQEAERRAEAAGLAQQQLVDALRSLTNRQDATPALARALTEADSSDPLSKAAQKLDLTQGAGPEQLALAGQAYIQALRDRVQAIAESLEASKGEIAARQRSEEELQGEVSSLRATLVDRDHQLENLALSLQRAKDEQAAHLGRLMDQRRQHDTTAALLKQAQEQLRMAQADLDELRARDGASSSHLAGENERLRQEIDQARAGRDALEQELADLRERLEAGQTRLRAQRDEFTRRLEERDALIQQKDRQLDQNAAQRGDLKGLEAQLATVQRELEAAQQRIKELESAQGEHVGMSMKSGDLARELKQTQADRDQLRDRLRQLEGELADASSSTAELRSQLEERRKDLLAAREKAMKEVAEERERTNQSREEMRKLKEEVVGMRARIRRLSDPHPGTDAFPIQRG